MEMFDIVEKRLRPVFANDFYSITNQAILYQATVMLSQIFVAWQQYEKTGITEQWNSAWMDASTNLKIFI